MTKFSFLPLWVVDKGLWWIMVTRSVLLSILVSFAATTLAEPKIIRDNRSLAPIPGIKVRTLLSGLEHPWGMAWLPDGSVLITERPGRLQHFKDGKLRPVSGVPAVFAAGQGGLLDIALHPQFSQNSLVYFTYAHGSNNANQTRVARAKYDGKTLSNWQVIWQAEPQKSGTQHFGSRMVWLPDRTLLVSVGDGGNPPLTLGGKLIREQAQNLDSHLGKVIRITEDGKIPPDTDRVVWTMGHRNIQGLAIDSETKAVWASEHGARGGDELNQLQGGKNYGWPLASRTRDYTTGLPIGKPTLRGFVDPVVVWQDTIAPSGLAIYRGDKFPAWQGNIFVGGLVSGQVQRLNIKGEVLGIIDIGRRVRDVRQGAGGFVYVLTDEPDGKLLRIEP